MYSNTTDGSTDNEAVKIANAFKPFWKKWMKEWGRNCVRSKKMTVTTAPSMSTGLIGVTDAFSDTECMIPFQNNVANANVGDTVWVKWMYDNQQTMYAENMGDIRSEKVILSGVKNAEPVPSGGSVSYSISFEKPFKETPVVVASMISPHSVETGLCSVRIWDISPFAFTVGYQNGSQYSRNIGASWIATGELLNHPIQYITDTTPYLNRAIPYSSNYLNLNKVVGVSVPWNQYCDYNESTPTANWSLVNATLSIRGRKMTITSASNSTARKGVTLKNFLSTKNHKYFVRGYITPSASNNAVYGFYNAGVAVDRKIVPYADGKTDISTIFGISASGYDFEILTANATPRGSSCVAEDVMLIDLTQMFGSTIADYIYSLEQSSAGSGVAYFRKLFPKPYYAYNSGELLSAQTIAHKMVGFNAYNPTTGTANVVGGNRYQITGAYTSLSLDGTTITPDANGKFTPSASGTMTVTGGNSTTTCVHLVWDGERNDEFEPYVEHVYPLDSSLTLRGKLKLDANNNLYADGDIYPPSGEVQRRYSILDLGTPTWQMQSQGLFFAEISTFDGANDQYGVNLVCSKYIGGDAYNQAKDKSIAIRVGTYKRIWVYDTAYTDVDTFKAMLTADNVQLVYKLATPTTETADEYARLQKCDPNGTEQFIDERTVQIPVGHETEYIIL